LLLVALVLGSAVVLALLLGTLWLGGGRREIGPARLARALLIAALGAALEGLLLQPLAGSFFYAIHLWYVDLVVVTPLAALAALVHVRARPLSRAVRRMAWLALALLPARESTPRSSSRSAWSRSACASSSPRASRPPSRCASPCWPTCSPRGSTSTCARPCAAPSPSSRTSS